MAPILLKEKNLHSLFAHMPLVIPLPTDMSPFHVQSKELESKTWHIIPSK